MNLYDAAWERVLVATAKWEALLGLDYLSIYHRRIDALADEPHQSIIAETKAQWQYKQASILWYVPNVATIEDDQLEGVVIHEFCHVLLASMECLITPTKHREACEYAIQNVADAIKHATKEIH